MLRRSFLKRMAFAALATVFLDLPLPSAESELERTATALAAHVNLSPEEAVKRLRTGLERDSRLILDLFAISAQEAERMRHRLGVARA